MDKFIRSVFDPSLPFRWLWRKIPVGSFELRSRFDAFDRPAHAYGMLRAAQEAKRLGYPAITAIEFGVAGGQTFKMIDALARELEKEFGVHIELVGFDNLTGLPPLTDYRDILYHFKEGDYPLNKNINDKRIYIGDVKDTVPQFLNDDHPPLGFIAFDLDTYTGTMDAFKVFSHASLPRFICYFDDVIDEKNFFNEFTGELLAIKNFNEWSAMKKIAKVNGLYATRHFRSVWPDSIYAHHDFQHPRYNE